METGVSRGHLCGAWRGAAAASAGGTDGHTTDGRTRTSFSANAGILYDAAEIGRDEKGRTG